MAAAARYMSACLLQVGEHNKKGRVLKAEKLTARTTIYPVLQAEEDRRQAIIPAIQMAMLHHVYVYMCGGNPQPEAIGHS